MNGENYNQRKIAVKVKPFTVLPTPKTDNTGLSIYSKY